VGADREQAYEIHWLEEIEQLERELIEQLAGRPALLVTTPTVAELYAAPLVGRLAGRADVQLEVMALTEKTKTLASVETLCRRVRSQALGRSSVLIGFGGGVCMDVVTTAASLVRRGITHFRVPTTLLGQVDAGIGCKGGVNFEGAKNYLGCFYPAEHVFLCPRLLPTLAPRYLTAGLAEVLKVAIASDAQLFRSLEEHGAELLADRFETKPALTKSILWRSVQRLLDDLEPNLFEDRTLVRRLDFGHTFSPQLEARSKYGLTHGEAVAIDMAFTTVLARELGRLSDADESRLLEVFARLGLPVAHELLTLELVTSALREATRHRGGALNLFLPTAIGSSECLHDGAALTPSVLEGALSRLTTLTRGA